MDSWLWKFEIRLFAYQINTKCYELSFFIHISITCASISVWIFSEDMIADMMKPEFRNYVKDLTSSKYGVVTDAKPNSNGLPHVASFRKLNIDWLFQVTYWNVIYILWKWDTNFSLSLQMVTWQCILPVWLKFSWQLLSIKICSNCEVWSKNVSSNAVLHHWAWQEETPNSDPHWWISILCTTQKYVKHYFGRDACFPTNWHFDKYRLRRVCAASCSDLKLQMLLGK